MSSTIADVLEGLTEALEGISGFNVYDTTDEAVSAPCAVLEVKEWARTDSDGGSEVKVSAAILLDRTGDLWDELLEYAEPDGSKSVVAVIEADDTLGGRVDSVEVATLGQFGSIAFANRNFYGFVVDLEVVGSG